jgi:hypothetical protein
MKYTRIFLTLFLITGGQLSGQDYLWPTNASKYMSSSFGEFRPGHYHAALDIKTWNTEGYPCYAVEDGYVERIRVSPFGYGKVIYVRLKDGNTALYAHLQKFSPEIDREIVRRQFENEKYRVDWWPENMTVKKGDLIAYTGQTGIGVPHLHFEIRDWKGRPVNPLQYYDEIQDNIRPQLKSMAIIPLNEASTVNGNYLPQKFNLTYIKDGIYIIREPLTVSGRIGLALNGYDQADGVYNKFAFYRTRMEIGGITRFELIYDVIDYAHDAYIYSEIYYPFFGEDRSVYHKLFRPEGNPLEFYKQADGSDGTIHMGNEPVPFTIIIEDFFGNTSQVRGELIPDTRTPLQIGAVARKGESAYLEFTTPTLAGLSFAAATTPGKWRDIDYFEIIEREPDNGAQVVRAKLTLPDTSAEKIRITVNDNYKLSTSALVKLKPEAVEIAVPEVHFTGKGLVVSGNGYRPGMYAHLLPADITLPLRSLDGDNFQVTLPFTESDRYPLYIALRSGSDLLWSEIYNCMSIVPGVERSERFFNGAVEISTTKSSAFDSTIISVSRDTIPDTLFSFAPLRGKMVKIIPDNVMLLHGIRVSMSADSLPAWGRWGVYRPSRKNGLSFVSNSYDSTSSRFRFRLRSFGSYVVASDTVAPEIEIVSPRPNAVYSGNPKVKMNVSDRMSGINTEADLSIRVDGNFVLPEWDPEEDIMTGKFAGSLEKGLHSLTVTVTDRAGNTTVTEVPFTVK